MKKMLLIASITMLATMGLFAVDPATATFDITAVKDYKSNDEEWTPSFSYEELYESEGDELLDGREIEINPAQLNESLDLFRVNYITNDSMRHVKMTVTTQPFINESADTIGVTYHFSDAVYVKDDNSAEWTTYRLNGRHIHHSLVVVGIIPGRTLNTHRGMQRSLPQAIPRTHMTRHPSHVCMTMVGLRERLRCHTTA